MVRLFISYSWKVNQREDETPANGRSSSQIYQLVPKEAAFTNQ